MRSLFPLAFLFTLLPACTAHTWVSGAASYDSSAAQGAALHGAFPLHVLYCTDHGVANHHGVGDHAFVQLGPDCILDSNADPGSLCTLATDHGPLSINVQVFSITMAPTYRSSATAPLDLTISGSTSSGGYTTFRFTGSEDTGTHGDECSALEKSIADRKVARIASPEAP